MSPPAIVQRPCPTPAARWSTIPLTLLLGGLTLALFSPACSFDFISFDDYEYVRDNPAVKQGLTSSGLSWAWGPPHEGLWTPLLWMSYMADVTLLGFSARSFHVTNILLHSLNVMLLFLLLRRLTRQTGRSLWVAAMFAAHPLVVEPVAWIASRKDLLSAFFSILTLHGYATYVRRPGWRNYLLTAVSMALALLSKPMAVTLPFVLLLLDFWPLSRSRSPERPSAVPWARLAMEKIPLLILAVVFCGIAYWAQQEAGFMSNPGAAPLGQRLVRIPGAYLSYLSRTIWPSGLSVLYPLPPSVQWGRLVPGMVVVIGLSVWTFRIRSRQPALLVGWLWFLGVLIPVIGIVQFGITPIADRFMYLPCIGLFIAAAWATELLPGRPAWIGHTLIGLSTLLAIGCGVATRANLPRWANPIALWKDTIRKGPHPTAYLNLAAALLESREDREGPARSQDGQTLGSADAASNSWTAARPKGTETEEAIAYLQESLRRWPGFAEAHNNLGMALKALGRYEEALASLERAHRLKPQNADACNNIAWLRATCPQEALRNGAEAVKMAEQACRLTENRNPDMLDTLAAAYAEAGRFQEAIETATKAVRLFREKHQQGPAAEAEARLNAYRNHKPWRE